jgi:hypothetical protein
MNGMDAKEAFVLDGSVTMVWGFDDEADDYADSILDRMPKRITPRKRVVPIEALKKTGLLQTSCEKL